MSTRLTHAPFLTTLFLVFGTNPVHTDELFGQVFIFADMSGSMFGSLPDPVTFQTQGILTGIAGYQAQCNEIRVTYVPWGNDIGTIIDDDLRNSAGLVRAIEHSSHIGLGDTKLFAAWSSAAHRFDPTVPTAVVILTNGSGRRYVTAPVPTATIYKVAVLSERAFYYLDNEFLPGIGKTVSANDVETITKVIEAALRSVDTLCLG